MRYSLTQQAIELTNKIKLNGYVKNAYNKAIVKPCQSSARLGGWYTGGLRLAVLLLLWIFIACAPEGQDFTEMVFIPAGSSVMGHNHPAEEDANPSHLVYLEAFWIDRYEVTNEQYRKCVLAKVCSEPEDLSFYNDPLFANHPVVYVSWYDATDYCQWMGKRLPSEAEWEKAARGDEGYIYPWGNESRAECLNAGRRFTGTTPVGAFLCNASPYGAMDMAGNVWEWVEDWYEPYRNSHYTAELFGQKVKVVRGGSWNHPLEDARSYHRDFAHPSRTLAVVGFRCADSP